LYTQIEEILHKLKGFEIQGQNALENPDLLILELGQDLDHEFDLVHRLSASTNVGEIFLASDNPDQGILIRAMRAGAREFFGPQVNNDEIQAAFLGFLERQKNAKKASPPKVGRIITVLGSKGGVGATSIAVNLATSIMEKSSVESVGLLDMNLFGDIHLFLGIDPTYSWSEITKNISRLDSTFLKNILSRDPSGVLVLPSPGYLNNQVVTQEIVLRLFQVMQQINDFIVVDVGQQMNEGTLKILEISDFVILVCVQSLPCLANANNMLVSFRNLGYPCEERTGIIVNRYIKKSNISLEDVELSLKKKVMWTIPNDYETSVSAINKGQPLNRFDPRQPITESFRELADSLLGSPEPNCPKKKKWWKL
ncbi:MAG: CpaE family protein, partial [Desulfatirhabdiaceae bacterium]